MGGWGGGGRAGGDCGSGNLPQGFRDPRQLFNRDRDPRSGNAGTNRVSGAQEFERSQEFMRRMREEGARRSAIPSQVDHMPRNANTRNRGPSNRGFW